MKNKLDLVLEMDLKKLPHASYLSVARSHSPLKEAHSMAAMAPM